MPSNFSIKGVLILVRGEKDQFWGILNCWSDLPFTVQNPLHAHQSNVFLLFLFSAPERQLFLASSPVSSIFLDPPVLSRSVGGGGGPCLLLWWQLSWPGWTNKYLCICMCVIVCVSVCICMCAHTCLCGHVQVCVNLCYYRTRKCVHEAKEKYIYRSASMCVCEFILLQIKTACSWS